MSRKRPKLEEIVAKLRQSDVLVGQGHSVAEAIRAIGVSEVTKASRSDYLFQCVVPAARCVTLDVGEMPHSTLMVAISPVTSSTIVIRYAPPGPFPSKFRMYSAAS